MISNQHRITVTWAAALTLYAACWFLPILEQSSGRFVGYEGAKIAHLMFVELVEKIFASKPRGLPNVFFVVFATIGWMANELFVLGVCTVWIWPGIAIRFLAFSLGIMVSWQVYYAGEFPLLIGYWLWVAAGLIVLWLSAGRLAYRTKSSVLDVITNKITLSFLLFPILNAAAMRAVFDVKW